MPSAASSEVLDRIERALEQATAGLKEPPAGAADHSARDAGWDRLLAAVEERLRALEGCAGRAAREVAEADAVLAGAAEALTRWCRAARAAAGKLASKGSGAVS